MARGGGATDDGKRRLPGPGREMRDWEFTPVQPRTARRAGTRPAARTGGPGGQGPGGKGPGGTGPGGGKPPRRAPKPPGLVARALRSAGFVVLWVTFGFGAAALWYARDLPSTDNLWAARVDHAITVLDRDGRVIGRSGGGHRGITALAQVSGTMVQAVLATEDRRFYEHAGLDPIGMARALATNIAAGKIVEGGSTITQQLAKNLFLENERTLERKFQEALLALWLEMRFTKDEILELYLNRVYFGAGATGVEAAAQRYFDKPASQLTLHESAILAGLLKAPSNLSPATNRDGAEARARVVLANMVAAGFVTEAEAAAAARGEVQVTGRPPEAGAQYFVDWALDFVPTLVTGGAEDLFVETTLDSRVQARAEQAIGRAIADEGMAAGATQGVIVAMTPAGEVVAMVGGRSYRASPFNRAIRAMRQPGSAFKLFPYAAALEKAGVTPFTMIDDTPVQIGQFAPGNFNDRYEGTVSVSRAFATSSNAAAVRLTAALGPASVLDMARRMGIVSDMQADASLALGTYEVTPLELASAYATLANDGRPVVINPVRRIRTKSGEVIWERKGEPLAPVLSRQTVVDLTAMLEDALVDGTGKGARLDDRPSAGKTGTSQDFRDAWFVGFTGDYVAAVWFGNDEAVPMDKVTGGGLPARTWKAFMTQASAGLPAKALLSAAGTSDLPVAFEEKSALDQLLEQLLGTDDAGTPPLAGPGGAP